MDIRTLPEHLHADLNKLVTLIEHHAQLKAQLEAQLASLVKTATGINLNAEQWALNPADWSLTKQEAQPGDAQQ